MSGRRGTARWIPALLTAAVLVAAGCGKDDQSGPGVLEGRVTSGASSLGAVVLVVDGSGITDISGSGATRAFVGPTTGQSRRIILVGPGTGQLDFEMEVEDVAARPTITVASAVNASNLEITALSAIDVRVSAR